MATPADISDAPPEMPRDPLEEESDNYKAPEKKSVNELLEQKEGEDEALQRYKAQLLGAAAAGGGTVAGDARRMVLTQMAILVNGLDAPLLYDADSLMSGTTTVVLKEGCEYKTQLDFRVQNELVSGLKYKNDVKRMAMSVLKVNEMLGSYGPDAEKVNTIVFPRREFERAPAGMMARGSYKCKTEFVDDDGATHLAFEYKLEIKKDWA